MPTATATWTSTPTPIQTATPTPTATSTIDPTLDTDGDGRTDGEEIGGNPQLGGQRDPLNYWDFYDVGTNRGGAGAGDEDFTRDKKVNFQDVFIILDHFGHEPTDADDHDLDRYIPDALKPWRTAEGNEPPSGDKVTFVDVLASLKSFGHGCTAPPWETVRSWPSQ